MVSTGSGGMAETVIDGDTGLVDDFRRPHALAERVRQLWGKRADYVQMSRNARQQYEDRYTEAAFGARLEGVLLQALEEKRRLSRGLARGRRRPSWHYVPHSGDGRPLPALIDGHMLGTAETGNETYVRGLLEGMNALGVRQTVAIETDDIDVGPHRVVKLGQHNDIRRVLEELPTAAHGVGAAVVHSTYIAPPRLQCARVVTVHDLSFLRNPGWFNPRDMVVLTAGVRATAATADHVIVPSQHSRDDAVELLGVPADRVTVTPEGVSPSFRPIDADSARPVMARFGIDRPYVLTLGNLQPRKNLKRLLRAWAALTHAGENGDALLVVGGGFRGRREDVAGLARDLHIEERVLLTGYVVENDLPILYSRAQLYVFPSLYEGFGLPLLEAMASGTAVAASNATSLPEVAGDAAAYFDPRDVDDMAGVIGALLQDDRLREQLRARGLERARRFTWEDCARRTLAVYEQAARRKGLL